MPSQEPTPQETSGVTNRRGALRREAIVDAAVRLFARRGWRATGLIGLAKEVGITHGGVLHHFGTKENLLWAVVSRRDEHQGKLIGAMGRYHGIDVIREVLPLAGSDQLDSPELTRLFAVLVAESFEPDEPLHDYFQGRHRLMRGYFAQAMRQAQARGEIRSDIDVDIAGVQISAFITGLQTLWLLDPDDIDMRAIYAQQVAVLLRGMSTSANGSADLGTS